MEAGPKASRRTILRHGVVALGALAGVVGLTGAAEKIRSSTQLTTSLPGSTQLILAGSDWHLTAPGLRPGDLPKRGDQVTVAGVIELAGSSEPAGSFFASVQLLDSPSGHGPYAAVQLETHTFQLPGGSIFGMGTTTPGIESIFAIVGGTGRYLGASGSYMGHQSPMETGGDGTAQFTLTLNPGR